MGDLIIPLATVHGFMLVLSRVAGVLVFAPIPGVGAAPGVARIVLSVSLTLALHAKWPIVTTTPGIADLLAWTLSELALGVTVGLLISFVTEMFAIAAQAISLPAGYTYASAVDPSTQAESNVLIILAQLVSGLLFFSLGLHRQLILALARGLDSYPPGSYSITMPIAEAVVRVGSSVFRLGFELALPILALLAMVDISLGLLGRLNSQLQVITLSFPVKMLVSLSLLAALGTVMPRLFQKAADPVMAMIGALLSPG